MDSMILRLMECPECKRRMRLLFAHPTEPERENELLVWQCRSCDHIDLWTFQDFARKLPIWAMTPPTRDLNLNYEISRLRDKLDNGEISQQEFRTKKSLVKLEEVYENWFDISSIERYYRYQKDKALNDHAKKRMSLYEFGNIINEIDKRKKHHRRVGDRYD